MEGHRVGLAGGEDVTVDPQTGKVDGDLLGFCRACFRVRWLAVVELPVNDRLDYGTCRSCAREPERHYIRNTPEPVRVNATGAPVDDVCGAADCWCAS